MGGLVGYLVKMGSFLYRSAGVVAKAFSGPKKFLFIIKIVCQICLQNCVI